MNNRDIECAELFAQQQIIRATKFRGYCMNNCRPELLFTCIQSLSHVRYT